MIARPIFGSTLLALAWLSLGQTPPKLLKLEAKYREQKDPVHQARVLAKLLPAEIQLAEEEIQSGETDPGIKRLERWRDQTQQVHQALLSTGRNPVKKPAGFTELQVAVRESLRRIRDIIFALPFGHRRRVESVRADLVQVNHQLLEELFPPPGQSKVNH